MKNATVQLNGHSMPECVFVRTPWPPDVKVTSKDGYLTGVTVSGRVTNLVVRNCAALETVACPETRSVSIFSCPALWGVNARSSRLLTLVKCQNLTVLHNITIGTKPLAIRIQDCGMLPGYAYLGCDNTGRYYTTFILEGSRYIYWGVPGKTPNHRRLTKA